jgi:4-diphosphocytidyl-2-C-methyl-D-erythritol kinase
LISAPIGGRRTAALAPAKLNLFLHVGPVGADGYHPVASLMVFADLGDVVRIEPAEALSLRVEGPFAAALAGSDPEDNLIMRAARALGSPKAGLVLDKRLPVAAGLGGGSSDAGAALRLLREHFARETGDAELEAIAGGLGADGLACLWGRAVVGAGRGDELTPAPRLPALPCVLVNPGVACPTGAVYRAFDALPPGPGADMPALPRSFASTAEAAAFLSVCRNDLEPAAAGLVPEVAETLARLRAEPEPLLVRLSGSGATCFALTADMDAARRLAARMAAAEPGWWVRPCSLA